MSYYSARFQGILIPTVNASYLLSFIRGCSIHLLQFTESTSTNIFVLTFFSASVIAELFFEPDNICGGSKICTRK
jgi:hypothetical protein